MEVCVDSIKSARNAEQGGAKRVELCANLVEGGTTPSYGMVKTMKKEINLPVFVMIRPRGGDFLYDDEEMSVMKSDIEHLKIAGADGFVFGALTADGGVDKEKCWALMEAARPLPVTFHRAIDMSRDIFAALENIVSLGFGRVLTSGGSPNALMGIDVITEMIARTKGNILVVPGGGISENNLDEILKSGAQEFHGSARHLVKSSMTWKRHDMCMGSSPADAEYQVKVTSVDIVRRLMEKANKHFERTS